MKDNSTGGKRGRKSKTDDRGFRPRGAKPYKDSKQIGQNEIGDVLNSLAAGVFKIAKDGQIVYANAQARRLLDMPDRDPVGMSLREFEPFTIWEDGSPCRYEDFPAIKCLRTGELRSAETIGLRLPGDRVLWVAVTAMPLLDPKTGQPESAIVTVVDSSHPKYVADSLRESEDRYRRLVELAPDAIIVHRGGPILMINDAGVRLYGGRSRDDFIGRNVLDFVHPRHRDKARRRMRRAMTGEALPLTVQWHVRLDGRTLHVEVTGTPCVYRGQHCVQVISRDVTRRHRAQRAVRRAKAQLEERVQQRTEELSSKNAELQQEQRFMERTLAVQERDRKLVAYEIHDTILQDVIGALMFVDATYENRGALDEENARRLEQVRSLLRKCIEGARRMISGLRPFIIDEQGIIGGIEFLVSELNSRGLEIRFTHSMKTGRLAPELESTVFRIVQEALANLERHSQAREGKVTITQRDATLRVEVRDCGIGFDPDAVGEGHYGLEGLKERARLAGGSASIHSTPGTGTEITVVLPLEGHQPASADN